MPIDLNAGCFELNRHEINPIDGPLPCQRPYLRTFPVGEMKTWMIETVRHPSLDLHCESSCVVGRNQIDLATADRNVSPDDGRSVSLKHIGCDPLAKRTESNSVLIRIGPCEPGQPHSRSDVSSSSMLTSLNVITFTRSRKRTGRYMSHTHASSIWISRNGESKSPRCSTVTSLAR